MTGAVERQFGSTSTNSRYRTPGSGRPGTAETERFRDAEEDIYDVDGAGLLGPPMSVTEGEAQVMGSKKMVDMFLSSRRKRMVSESEQSGVFI